MFYAIPDYSLVSSRKSFASFLQRLDCTSEVDVDSNTNTDETSLNARFPPQLDGNMFSYDPYRRCRSRNYRCCDSYGSNCTEIFGGRYWSPFSYFDSCPTPTRYRRGYGFGSSWFGGGYRTPYSGYGDMIADRRIADREHIDPIVVNDTRPMCGDLYSGHGGYGSTYADVDCTTCVTSRTVCTRSGYRRHRLGYLECSRWGGGGYGGIGGIGYMRGYDGANGIPDNERLSRIEEMSDAPEMSGGLAQDDDHSQCGYDTAVDSLSYFAAETSNPLQLAVVSTPNKTKAERAVLAVRALIDKDGNNRTWVMNIEEICRTECCRYKRIGDEGVLQKTSPHLAVCKEVCWKSNNCEYELDCKHKPPAIRFFESLGQEYLDKIHAIRLQTKEAAFLNPFEVASAIDLVIKTFPKAQHAQVILHSDDEGEIIDKESIKLLIRTFRKLDRSLPLVEKLKIINIEQHPGLMRKWTRKRKRWAVLRAGNRAGHRVKRRARAALREK